MGDLLDFRPRPDDYPSDRADESDSDYRPLKNTGRTIGLMYPLPMAPIFKLMKVFKFEDMPTDVQHALDQIGPWSDEYIPWKLDSPSSHYAVILVDTWLGQNGAVRHTDDNPEGETVLIDYPFVERD